MKNKNNIVKSIAIIILAIGFSMPAHAQDEEMSTLFGDKNGNVQHGGWGGLTFGYTKIGGKDTYLMGGRGGWLIDHRFTIGLAGSGFVSDNQYTDIVPDEVVNLVGGYGGLFLEAIIMPNSPVHVTIPVIIGAGGVAYTQDWRQGNYDYEVSTYDSDAYFVLEPGLEVEFNVIKFMRISLGGSYRYTSNIDLINSSSTMLRGFNGYFGLKFGSF